MTGIECGVQSAIVCLNGECDAATHQQLLARLDRGAGLVDALVVAVDGGLRHTRALDLTPDWLIGDMDSAAKSDLTSLDQTDVRKIQYPVEKDTTDFELAFRELAKADIKRVLLVGVGGGRLDHTLANLLLLGRSEWPFAIEFYHGDCHAKVATATEAFDEILKPDTTVSLLPLCMQATGVTTSGLYYPLNKATINPGSTLGISNLVMDGQTTETRGENGSTRVTVTLESGSLLVTAGRYNDPGLLFDRVSAT